MARYVPIILTASGDAALQVVERMTNAFEDMDRSSEKASSGGLRSAFIQADLTSRAISHLTRDIIDAAKEYLQVGRELSNLDTLLDPTDSLAHYRDGLLDLDPTLGKTSELARGMYQTISSGVEASESLDFIATSAKAARAGLADTFETVDAGTSVMASFGLKSDQITSIYDKMFETVKRGKVELPQLAQSIGLVSNVAAQTGVTIDEMFAGIATASRTNRPAVAIEGFRTALVNIIKPSQQAVELAASLGLQFDIQALKAKGLAKFLNDAAEATGGDAAKLAVLFGDVQALNFVLSVTGNQAKTFAEDLRGISQASGTVEEAFQKQQQSLAAQADALKVSFQQGVIKTLLFFEPLLTGTLKAVNQYPSVFGVAAIAVAGLAAAHALYNTQLAISAVTSIPKLIKGIQDVIFWMVHFQTALTSLQTGLAATAGWVGLAVAAIGLIIYAIRNYETAADRANKITVEQVNVQAKAHAQNKETAQELEGLSSAQSLSAEQHERLNAILGQLDPTTQAYINSLKEEKEKVEALAGVIKNDLHVNQIELEATLRTTAKGILEQAASLDRANSNVKEYEDVVSRANKVLREGNSEVEASTGAYLNAQTAIDRYSQKIVLTKEAKEKLTKAIADNIEKNIIATQQLGYNRDALINFYASTLNASDQQRLFSLTIDRTTQAANENAKATNKTTAAIDQQTNSVRDLRAELQKLAAAPQATIDEAVLGIVQKAKNAAEARRLAREALKDQKVGDAVKESRRLSETEKAARDVFTPSTTGAGGSRGSHRGALSTTLGDAFISSRVQAEFNTAMRKLEPRIKQLIIQNAQRQGIPENLAFAQIFSESRFNRTAVAPSTGARGLGQFLPGTGAQYGLHTRADFENPDKALSAWGKYMRHLFDKYGDWELATLAYHQGEGNVDQLIAMMNKSGAAGVQKYLAKHPAGRQYQEQIRALSGLNESQRFEPAKPDTHNDSLKQEIDALIAHREHLLKIAEDYDSRSVESVRSLAELRVFTNEEAEKKIVAIELAGLDRRLQIAKEDVDNAIANSIEFTRLNDQYQELLSAKATAEEQAQRRIAAARERDIEDLRQYTEHVRDLQLENQRTTIDIQRGRIDRAERLGVDSESIRRAHNELDITSENLDYLRQSQELRAQLERDTLTANNEQKAEIESLYRQRQELLETQHQDRLQEIRERPLVEYLQKVKEFSDNVGDVVGNSLDSLYKRDFRGFWDSIKQGFSDLFKDIIKDSVKSKVSQVVKSLILGKGGAGGSNDEEDSGAHAQQQGAGRGFFGTIKNLFSGGGGLLGGGGYKDISIEAQNVSVNGGVGGIGGGGLGNFFNLFRTSKASNSTGDSSSNGGGGGFFSRLFGGNSLSSIKSNQDDSEAAEGSGSSGAVGGLPLGKIGALLTNPYVIAGIGAAIGGYFLIKHFFGHRTEKALRKTIQQEYGIAVKDMKLLSQIKGIGEQTFGKGNVRKHLLETVRLEPVKELLQNYAEATNQKSSKLVTNAQLQDPGNEQNQFVRRLMGGLVPFQRRGMDYVPLLADGGEYVANADTTAREGVAAFDALNAGRATIVPKPKKPVRRLNGGFVPSGSGSSSGSQGSNQGSGTPAVLVAAHIGVLNRVAAAIERIESATPGDWLRVAVEENPESVVDGLDEGLNRSHSRTPEIQRKLVG